MNTINDEFDVVIKIKKLDDYRLRPQKTVESLLYTLNKIFLLNYRVKPYKIVEEEMVMKVADDSDVKYGKINE